MRNRIMGRPFRFYRNIIPTFFVAFLPGYVPDIKAETLPDQFFSLSLKQLAELEITSPTLTRKTMKSVPASVTVFTRQQIRNMGADYLYEVINFVPGFQSFRRGTDGMQYFHSARGYRTSVKNREILILLDGVRLIREADGGAAVPMLSLHNVEKIEFIRGPGSAIYGSNAFSGVINIQTTRDVNAAHIAAGEAGRKQLNTVYHYSEDDTELNLALNLFDEKGERYTLQNINTSPQDEVSARDPREGQDLQITARKGDYQIKGLISRRKAEDFYIVERAASDTNESRHDSAHFYLTRDIGWSKQLLTSVEVGYSESSFKLDTVIAGLGITRTDQDEKNLHLNIRNGWDYAENQSLEFGLQIRDNEASSVYQSETNGYLKFYPDSERTITGLYLQHQYHLDNNLQLVVGARYDDYDDVGDAFSPRVSLVYPLTDHQTLKALYGEAFRAPVYNELYLTGVTLSGNPQLDPETIKTSELIWHGSWDAHNITVNTHYSVVEDAIYSTNTFHNQTSDESSYGLEIDYAVQPSDQWLLQMTYTRLEGLPRADFRQADQLASLVINYSRNRWNLNVSATYTDTREMMVGSERIEVDDYWLVNSKWIYSLSRSTNIYLNGRNILDEDYGTPTRLSLHTQPIPNRGRELVLGAEYQF